MKRGGGITVVTGATGKVGRELVRALTAGGESDVRAAGASVEALRATHGSEMDVATLDFHEPSTFDAVLASATTLFLVRPPTVADIKATLAPFVDLAFERGVRHVVFLSVAGAGDNPLVPHHAVEQHLKGKLHAYTILRPGFFVQNLGETYRDEILHEGRLFVPAARGRVAFVDVRDVAEVAALVLRSPEEHRGKAYTLTGPEAITFEEVAELLSEVLGRTIRYEPASVVGYVRRLHARGMSLAQIATQTVLHVGLRYGQAEHVDPTLERLIGHRGHTVERYVRDHDHLWRRQEPEVAAAG